MQHISELIKQYYNNTHIINGEYHFKHHRLPVKEAVVHCQGGSKRITLDFNKLYNFVDKYYKCEFVSVDGTNYSLH